jgi:hypothetical protein
METWYQQKCSPRDWDYSVSGLIAINPRSFATQAFALCARRMAAIAAINAHQDQMIPFNPNLL